MFQKARYMDVTGITRENIEENSDLEYYCKEYQR
jgi:hypothetical protein